MQKNIVVEISGGVVQAVWCPDAEFEVHILDHDDVESEHDPNVQQYYRDVANEIDNLVNCF